MNRKKANSLITHDYLPLMKADVLLCASLLLKYYSLTPRENVTMLVLRH